MKNEGKMTSIRYNLTMKFFAVILFSWNASFLVNNFIYAKNFESFRSNRALNQKGFNPMTLSFDKKYDHYLILSLTKKPAITQSQRIYLFFLTLQQQLPQEIYLQTEVFSLNSIQSLFFREEALNQTTSASFCTANFKLFSPIRT